MATEVTPMKAAIGLFCALCCATSLGAAPRPRHNSKSKQAGASERLGSVNFATSCSPDAQKTFNTALALLHNFQYQEAEQTFTQITQQDSTCAIAYWGKAMSLYHQLWDWPTADTLKEGHDDTMQAQKLRAQTERERMYIVAAGVFFQNNPNLSKASRIKAYSDWMNRIFTKYPDDVNAGAFYALSLIALQGKKADQDANRQQAIDILNKLMAVAPGNPGVLHYLIHASDTQELAQQGLAAARRYGAIAPDSSHAVHMPSHIFVRLGLWQDSINSNIAANASGAHAAEMHMAEAHYQTHAMDFLSYSYLQSGQEAKAREVIEHTSHVVGATDANKARDRDYLSARTALELHRWKEAAELPLPADRKDWDDTTVWARAIGAARSGDVTAAESAVKDLTSLVADREQHARKEGYSTSAEKPSDLAEAEAWLAFAKGKSDEAIAELRAAADHQDKNGGESVGIPAREMLADMLMEVKRPTDALTEYKASL